MRRLFGFVFVCLLIVAIILPWLALDRIPALEPPGEFRRSDLAWVKLLFQKHDPRRQTPDVVQTIHLDETELNRLLNYAVELPQVNGFAVELTPGLATLTVTFALPHTPFGRYLNIAAEFSDTDARVHIQRLRIGSLPVPAFAADWGMRLGHTLLKRDGAYAALAEAFAAIRFDENQAALDYRWHPALLTQIERAGAELLIDADERALMLAYADRLNTLLKPYAPGSTQPLVEIVARLFETPLHADGNVAAENRAALTALAAYLAGISLPRLLDSDSASIRRAPQVLLSLYGRRDFAEHYLLSAAIAANAGGRLANAIGLIKEEEDARRGSGFSFTDLASNRAGVRLAERATGDHAAAVRARLTAVVRDEDLLPALHDLPEFMPQTEFDRRFGPVGGPRYQAVIARIDTKLETHPLFE